MKINVLNFVTKASVRDIPVESNPVCLSEENLHCDIFKLCCDTVIVGSSRHLPLERCDVVVNIFVITQWARVFETWMLWVTSLKKHIKII